MEYNILNNIKLFHYTLKNSKYSVFVNYKYYLNNKFTNYHISNFFLLIMYKVFLLTEMYKILTQCLIQFIHSIYEIYFLNIIRNINCMVLNSKY